MNEQTIVFNPELAWREIEGRVVAISPADSVMHELNETASFIWKQADRGLGLREIVASLADEFGVDTNRAQADTEELLAVLHEKGLVIS